MMKKNSFVIQKKTAVLYFVYIIFVIIAHMNIYSEYFNNTLAIGTILLSGVFVYKCRKCIPLLFISLFIAYSNYSIAVGIYLFPELRPKYLYPQITDVDVYGIGIMLIFLLMFSLCVFIKIDIKNMDNIFSTAFIRKENYNSLFFFFLVLIFLFIMIFGYKRSSNGRGSSSPIYEYNVIIALLAFYYSGDKKILKYICLAMTFFYAFTSFLNGTRVEALSVLMIAYICYSSQNISSKTIVIYMVLGIIMFNFIGAFRGNYSNFGEAYFSVIQNFKDSKFVFDTCTHAYFPSLCMIEQFKRYNFFRSMHFFFRFLLTIIMGSSRVTDGNLIKYTSLLYYHNGGGVIVGFLYAWLSYLGPCLFALLFGFVSKRFFYRAEKKDSDYVAMLYIMCSTPRWYLYGPWAFFRGTLICLTAFWITIIVNKLIEKK